MNFRQVVEEMVDSGLRRQTPSLQGRIPANGINQDLRTCEVHIPNPHGGIDPRTKDQAYITLKNVPLPEGPGGFIDALFGLVVNQDRACTIGFKGGNLSFPYVVNLLEFIPDNAKNRQKVENRESTIANQIKTATAPNLAQWTTNPLAAAAQQGASLTASTAAAKVATNEKVLKSVEKIKTDLINPVKYMFGGR